MKKRNCLFVLLAAGTLITNITFLTSCDRNDNQLTIWAWNKNVDALKAGIETYKEKINPNFNAKVESFARLDIDKKFKTASQNDNKNAIADIILCDGMNVLSYYDIWSDIFIDLSKDVDSVELNKLVPSTLDTVQVDDKLIGLPLDVAPTVVFANTKLWSEEDLINVKTNGWTWEDYNEIGLKIKKAKGNDIEMTSFNKRGDDRVYRTMTSQKGEWFMNKDYECYVGNENSVAAMNTIKKMKDNGVVGHIDTGDYKSLMKNNKIAAQIQGFFLGGQLKDVAPEMKGNWTVLPLPKWDKNDETSASITGGSYLYANSKLTGENKKQAIEFIKWMTLNEETSMQSLKVGGVYPALRTSYENDFFKKTKDPYFTNDSVWGDVSNWSKDATAIVATKYNAFNYDVFIKAQEKILFSDDYESIEIELKNAARVMINNAK